MNRRFFTTFLFVILLFEGFSQSVTLLSATKDGEIIIQVNVPNIEVTKSGSVKIPDEKSGFILKNGAPNIQKLTVSMIIPDIAGMKTEVLASDFYEIPDIYVTPSKGNIFRDTNPKDVPLREGKEYSENDFFPNSLAELKSPYIVRDFRAQSLWIYPVQYNPITKILRVFKTITIRVYPEGVNPQNLYQRQQQVIAIEQEFSETYRRQFINYEAIATYTPISESGSMLIICPPAFLQAMQPFVNWKQQKGIPVEIIDLATVGNTPTQIKDYISQYYTQNHTLKYVLLVGDNAQLPCMTYNGNPSDNAYAYLLGTDSYPEVFMGRFSGENVQEIETLVAKVIQYEKTPSNTASWYHKGICIASEQGPGDDNEMDYEHEHNIRTQLLSYTYTTVSELYDGTQTNTGYVDAPGNPIASDLSTLVNSGVGLINYTGHGGPTEIVTTGHSVQDVLGLTNTNQFPFLWEVGCVSGEFMNTTCYAEAWLRATHPVNNSLTGSAGVFASTINQSWDPPMEGQDAMNDILTESIAGNIKRTFGGISFNGCMQMNDVYGTNGADMTDTWTLFGDPSIMMFTNTPQAMTITHNATVNLGSYSFPINGSVEGAFVALTQNNEIIGTGVVSGGSVTINLYLPLTVVADITVTATAWNTMPYIGTVQVTVPTSPFVIGNILGIDDTNGNQNQLADFGETISLNVSWQNVGSIHANSATAVLSSANTAITILNANASCGNIAANTSVVTNQVFQIQVNNDVADGTTALLVFTVSDNAGNTWSSYNPLLLNAPKPQVLSMEIQDASGNNNGFFDPGETVTVIVHNANIGHAALPISQAILTPSHPLITVNINPINVPSISPSNQGDATFSVTADASIPKGTPIQLDYSIESGTYQAQATFNLLIAPNVLNFEPNNNTFVSWTSSGASPWFTSTLLPYEGSYCEQSGVIANNQSSSMSFVYTITQADSIHFYRKVSSEEGWDFLYFYIDNIEVGKWSGEINWEKLSYPVAAGIHTFMWKYAKDGLVSEGEDAGFIDYILLPDGISTDNEAAFFEKKEVSLFPNPASGITHIRFISKTDKSATILLTDIQGKTLTTFVSKQETGLQTIPLNITDYSPGLYFVRVIMGDNVCVKKLWIRR